MVPLTWGMAKKEGRDGAGSVRARWAQAATDMASVARVAREILWRRGEVERERGRSMVVEKGRRNREPVGQSKLPPAPGLGQREERPEWRRSRKPLARAGPQIQTRVSLSQATLDGCS